MSTYITGTDRTQSLLLPERVEEYVRDDNPVRFLDAYVNSLQLATLGFAHALPNKTGRPPYHPADLIKLYLYGYLNKIRSSRQLEAATHKNLELIWLMRKLHPDFKTISDFRKNNFKALKRICREFTLLCKKFDLFGCELIAIDGSKLKAVNSHKRNYTKDGLKGMLKKVDRKISIYLNDLDEQDKVEVEVNKPERDKLKEQIETLEARKQEIKDLQQQLEESGELQISLTDPDSRNMRTADGGNDLCYNVQLVTDSKHKLIVAHEVTNDANDLNQLHNMAVQAKKILDVEHIDAIADKGYFNTDEIKKCSEDKINCYVPQPRLSKNRRLGLFTDKEFLYSAESDQYICPAQQALTFRFQCEKGERTTRVYEASACKQCPLKAQCRRSKNNNRRIYRWVHQHIIEEMRDRMTELPDKIKKRKELIEHPFGTINHWNDQSYFLTKGLQKVATEMALTVLAYNIKRVINILGVKELIAKLA